MDLHSPSIVAENPSPESAINALNLLFVEDSEEDAQSMLEALRATGFEVTHQRVGTAAGLKALLDHEKWDAVICSLELPALTGFDALDIVRSVNPDIPFILMSRTLGEDRAVAAMKAGASDYIMKTGLARLAPALRRELEETPGRAALRRAQRDLIASENRFRGLTALSSDWYWEQDENLRFTFISPGLPHRYSEALDSCVGKTRWELPYRNADWAEHRKTIEAHQPFHNVELEPFTEDGSRVYISISGEPVFDAKGKFHGYRGVGSDITERVTRVDDLRLFNTAMDAISDGIFLVDRDSMRFVHVNDAACRLHGLPRDQVLALEPFGILAGSRARLEKLYDALIASGAVPAPEESLWRRKHGSAIWIDIRRHAQLVRERWTIVIVVRDITERKADENKLRRLNRLYAMVSGINALVVLVRDRNHLFNAAVQIAAEQGEFEKVWIALVDGTRKHIVPAATAGFDGDGLANVAAYLASAQGGLDGEGLASRAIREKRVAICKDLVGDGEGLFGDLSGESDICSGAVFPLIVADEAIAVVGFLTSRPEFFDAEGLKLLTEVTGNIASAIDHIDKRERLDYLAYYDALTGLANRRLFLDRLAQYLRSAAHGNHRVGVVLLDLERFKNINDTLGRQAGDSLLVQVATWLVHNAGDSNEMARVGANLFAVVLPKVADEAEVARLVEAMLERLAAQSFTLSDASYRIAAKVGIVLFPDDGTDVDTLFKHAEVALKKAKVGGDRYLFYAQKMTETVAGTLGLENQLRHALERREFVLYYQPKVCIETGRLTGAEALMRWNSPQLGLVPPIRFIPILEQTGMIHEVGRWAMSEAVQQYLRWLDAELPAVRVAVNVSPLQLRHRDFVAEVERAIRVDERAPGGLELELTESLIMENVEHSTANLQAIRTMGVRIAIDDFGTGFSSLSYLGKLPVDTLKIDRAFVVDMIGGVGGMTLVSVIINLAQAFKLKVVAEGVETDEQLLRLRSMQCDEMQGYLFGKPVPFDVFQQKYLTGGDMGD
jgi:diguanylate cyclase (GGDEF)-like protein/PAS domain S-box-containing protein